MEDNKSTAKKKKNKSGLEKSLITMALLPMILMGVVITVASYYVTLKNAENEVKRNLRNSVEAIDIYYDETYPGDWAVEQGDDGSYCILKGGTRIEDVNELLDKFMAATDLDYTIFYYDVRMATTIRDKNSERILYTIAQPFVSDAVINQNQERFYNNVEINGEKYFGFYSPLTNSDKKNVGMLFAGKSTKEVESESFKAVMWLPVAILLFSVLGAVIATIPAHEIIKSIDKEKKFLSEIAKGNLAAKMDESMLVRKDELGDMAKFTRSVQHFIRDMIERDALTKLYTRRVGETKINYTQYQLSEAGVLFCVCMADIDFFKKFNDTYGHDCGDLVLSETARIFNENMLGKGYTIRWGGEEFLIIYEDFNLDKAYAHLQTVREKIINNVVEYNGQKLSVTMTFGITEGDAGDFDNIIKEADNLLYVGKQNGRNCIVTKEIAEKYEKDKEE